MTKTYADFKQNVYGRAFNIDGAYGAQCWDGYAQYCKYLGYPYANCTATGYVKDIWNNRKSNGMLNNFTEVALMQPGDIAVFKEVAGLTPYSHIAIFDHDEGAGYGWFLGQNQGGANGAFNLCKLPYSATFDTAFRPKCFSQTAQPAKPAPAASAGDSVLNSIPADFIRENATFYPNTTIKIRKAPSLKGQDTGLVYKAGMSVRYDGYVRREGYVWISWISASDGTRRWMAAGELNSAGVNVKPYGTFK